MHAFLFLLWLAAGADAGMATDAALTSDAGHPDASPEVSARPETTAAPATPLPWFGIAGVRTRQPVVALTFDACATMKQDNSFDREIFEILQREQVPDGMSEAPADDQDAWGAWMARAQAGDTAAYHALLSAVVPYLRAIARRLEATP